MVHGESQTANARWRLWTFGGVSSVAVFVLLLITSVASAAELPVYGDALSPGWQDQGFAREIDLDDRDIAFTGTSSVAVEMQGFSSVWFEVNDGQALTGSDYTGVRFWIHSQNGGEQIEVEILERDFGFDENRYPLPALEAGWQEIQINLSDLPNFTDSDDIYAIAWRNRSGSVVSFNLDDVSLIESDSATPGPVSTTTTTGPPLSTTTSSVPSPSGEAPVLPIGAQPTSENFELVYTIDRSNVPPVSFPALTLNIYLGALNSVAVQVDGSPHPHNYDPSTGYLTLTTTGSNLVIDANGATNDDDFGYIQRGQLKDNRSWAWSHGLDDNVFLQPTIALFEERDWQGSIYLISNQVLPTRDEEFTIDEPQARVLLNNGWSLGGHGSDNTCADFNQPAIIDSMTRIDDIVQGSNRPNYLATGFAAPCFVAEYHPVVLNMRNQSITDVRFNESGNSYIQAVDQVASNFTANGRTAFAFDYDAPIGRDLRIEFAPFAQVRDDVDWIAQNSTPDRHLWYNSLTHGNQEDNVAPLINHIYNNYGPGGDNSVWVAPADEIYSYLLTRDSAAVTLDSVSLVSVDPPEPEPEPEPEPVNVAPLGTASQSSTGFGGVASRAIDDNTAGRYRDGSVTHTSRNEVDTWWQLELANQTDIDTITLWNRTDGCCDERLTDISIFVSQTPFPNNATRDELINNTNIFSFTFEGTVGQTLEIPVNTQGQYIRIHKDTRALSLAEVQVFG